jgi:CO dehydrogenase maturation factor
MDMEAGIEHLGRGTSMGVDLMLAVVEPGQRSIETARRVREMAAALGIRRFGVVLNKSAATVDDRAWVAAELGADCLLGTIPYDSRIAQADRSGVALGDLGHADLLAPFLALRSALELSFQEKTR